MSAAHDGAITLPGTAAFDTLLARLREGAAGREAKRIPPFAEIELLRQARTGALRLARDEGGAGLNMRDYMASVIALAAADANIAHILRNHAVFVDRYAQPWTGESSGFWRAEIARGAIFGIAAPEQSAHNVGRTPLDTRLIPEAEGWQVSGTKSYSTGCLYADYITIRAQDEDERYASVILPAQRSGISLIDDWDGIGQRLTGSGTTRLSQVHVQPSEVLFDADNPGFILPYAATLGHLYLAAVLAGILRNLHEDARDLILSRSRTFAHAPSEKAVDDPLLQMALGEIDAAAFAAEALVLHAATALERATAIRASGGFDTGLAHEAAAEAARAKVVIDRLVQSAGAQIFDVGGASAAARDKNLDRHWRNARTLISHNPTAYKAMALGALALKGTSLPDTGFF